MLEVSRSAASRAAMTCCLGGAALRRRREAIALQGCVGYKEGKGRKGIASVSTVMQTLCRTSRSLLFEPLAGSSSLRIVWRTAMQTKGWAMLDSEGDEQTETLPSSSQRALWRDRRESRMCPYAQERQANTHRSSERLRAKVSHNTSAAGHLVGSSGTSCEVVVVDPPVVVVAFVHREKMRGRSRHDLELWFVQ